MTRSNITIISTYQEDDVRFADFSDGATIREDAYSCECSVDDPDGCPHFALYDEQED